MPNTDRLLSALASLRADDGEFAARVFGVTEAGTFEHGASVLQRQADPEGTPHPEVVSDPEAAARTMQDHIETIIGFGSPRLLEAVRAAPVLTNVG